MNKGKSIILEIFYNSNINKVYITYYNNIQKYNITRVVNNGFFKFDNKLHSINNWKKCDEINYNEI